MDKPTKEVLQSLRDNGETRGSIAEKYGVSTSRVKRWLHDLGVTKKINKKIQPAPPLSLPWDEGLTLSEKCQLRLGSRMKETSAGYYLDGRLSSLTRIAETAGLKIT
jgi:hypothetical protein